MESPRTYGVGDSSRQNNGCRLNPNVHLHSQWRNSTIHIRVVLSGELYNFPVNFDSVKKGPAVATTPNFLFTSPANDVWYIKLYVNDSTTNQGESPIITVYSAPLTITISPASATLNMTRRERCDFSSSVAGGTIPYSYLWFTKNDTGVHDWVVAYPTTYGNTSPKYRFSTRAGQGSHSTGKWELKCQVTDFDGTAVNSTASRITVNRLLCEYSSCECDAERYKG